VPFRGVVKDLQHDQAVQLLVAGPGDVEVQIGIKPYGATGTSGAPNFWVGGPDLQDGAGLLVTANQFTTDLDAGDELWVKGAEELPFASKWQITALIRTARRPAGAADGWGQ
jgi:hypothetical protein